MDLFDIEDIDKLADTLFLVGKVYPKEVKSFMQEEGKKLKKITVKAAKAYVGEKTGNYIKGIKKGKYYKYKVNGADSIRVYAGRPANHAHLIEYGHRIVSHSGEDTGKVVAGHLIFKAAGDVFDSEYEKDCEDFADKIIEPLNKG